MILPHPPGIPRQVDHEEETALPVTQPESILLPAPDETFVYEYDVHQEGSYFLHPHVAMQEAIGRLVP